jgi:outer membrane usher protein
MVNRIPRVRKALRLLAAGASVAALSTHAAVAQSGANAVAPAAAAPAAGAVPGAPPAQPQRTIDVNLPLELNGFYLGDIAAKATMTGEIVAVDAPRFLALVSPRLAEVAAAALAARVAQAGATASIEALAIPGIAVEYDTGDLKLVVTVSADSARAQDVALAPSIIDKPTDTTIMPADYAAGVNLFASKAFTHRGVAGPSTRGFQPTTVGIDSFVNLGGIDGVTIVHQSTFQDGPDGRYTRGPITLLHDDWRNAVRYAAGDVDPFPLPLQGATPLGGLLITRAYADLQPTRNVRPAGRTNFILERDAIVEVEVNGVVTRTLQLRAGTYNLRDLPFTEGLNEVRLLIQDAAGRREIASFSRSFTSTLLEQGIDEFSFAVGMPRIGTIGGFTYLTEPQVTGFYRVGLTQSLTLGVNAQGDRFTQLFGGEGLLATRLGTFRFEAAVSRTRGGRTGIATTAGWIRSFILGGNPGEIEALWDHRSRDYTTLNQGRFGTDLVDDVAVRYRQALSGGFFANATFGRSERRQGVDETRWSGGLSRGFGPFFLSVLYEGRQRDRQRVEHAGFLNLSLRLGTRENVTARYATREDRYRLEYERSVTNRLGDWGIRAGLGGADGERSLQGQIDYFSNRAEAGARFDLFDDTLNGARARQTTLRLATAIGFADGAVAVGRPFRDGFAVVRGHRTLDGAPIDVSAGVASEVYARTGALGPALVSTTRAYQRNPIRVDVADLPAGYDLGAAAYELFPGTRSGFKITVGSDASRTVMGVLVDEEGAPIVLLSGEMRSLDRLGEKPVALFTNRTGRFVASAVRPGRYVVEMDGKQAEVTIAKDRIGLVDAGRLRMEKGSLP